MPRDTSSCVGEIACFGVQVDATAGNLDYQWYISTDNAGSWVPLSNDGNYSGVRSDSMCILDVAGLDGALFRVDIQTEACSTISSFDPMDISTAASLDVNEAIAFDLDPQSEAICGGDSTLFIVDINSTDCLLYTSPSPRDRQKSRMPSSA